MKNERNVMIRELVTTKKHSRHWRCRVRTIAEMLTDHEDTTAQHKALVGLLSLGMSASARAYELAIDDVFNAFVG